MLSKNIYSIYIVSACSRAKIQESYVKQRYTTSTELFKCSVVNFYAMSRNASVKCGSTLGSDSIGRHDIGPCRR
jgi:hypothetical protein